MKKTICTSIIYYLIFVFANCISTAQIDYSIYRLPKDEFSDSLAKEMAFSSLKSATGLLEKEIEPDKYILGQGDELAISIISAKPKHFEISISPEGALLIPGIGKVDLKGKTLTQAISLIEELIRKRLNPAEIHISLQKIRQFKVSVSGLVVRNGIYPATPADRVSEVIDKAGGLRRESSWRNIILLRSNGEQKNVDLMKFYFLGDEEANPYVLGGDKIIVPEINEKTIIGLYGDVVNSGLFEYREGDSLSTLLKFGLGFTESAFLDSVEYYSAQRTGFQVSFLDLSYLKNQKLSTEKIKNDFPLNSGDRIFVRSIPKWRKLHYVVIKGEVNFPGYYAIEEKKDRVTDLIKRAGGFTDEAAVEFVEYISQYELEKPDLEMERLSRVLPSEMSESEFRYFQSRKTERKGVISIDFRKIMNNPNTPDNFYLTHRDSIVVPSIKKFVNVQGRVAKPGLIAFRPGADYLDYIELAGGFGYRADESETMINKHSGGLFRAKKRDYVIEPGDVILVPPERELTFMEAFTKGLTIATQILTIAGVALAFSNINKK
ncbi:MAG: SLBB domain-containing protein [Ignavibacteria bacterium]|nr:SLBB domain-containing protein [Ignavibacteria bacterium]